MLIRCCCPRIQGRARPSSPQSCSDFVASAILGKRQNRVLSFGRPSYLPAVSKNQHIGFVCHSGTRSVEILKHNVELERVALMNLRGMFWRGMLEIDFGMVSGSVVAAVGA